MRTLARFLLGALFVGFLPLFFISHAARTTLLERAFWQQTFLTSGMYKEVGVGIADLHTKMRVSVNPPSEGEVQTLVEANIDRIIDYIQGKNTTLILSLSPADLHIPPALTRQPPLSLLSNQTDVMMVLGQVIKEPKDRASIEETLKTIQLVGSNAPLLSGVFLLGSVVAFIGVFFLGKSFRSKVQGSSIVLLLAGISAFGAAIGGKSVFTSIATNIQNMPQWGAAVLVQLVDRFFVPGMVGGGVASVIGLSAIFGSLAIPASGDKAKGKQARGSMKAVVLVGAGILLLVILLGLKTGGLRVSVNKGGTTTSGDAKLAQELKLKEEQYTSPFGWSIRYPQGWQVNQVDELKLVGFNRRVDPKNPNERGKGALLAIEPTKNLSKYDTGQILRALVERVNTSGFQNAPNSRLVGVPSEDTWHGWKRIIIGFEHDDEKSSARMQQIRWYLVPVVQGDGYLLYGQSAKEFASMYAPLFEEAMSTFALTP